jgi:hypothetical protein
MEEAMNRDHAKKEVEANYKAFVDLLPQLLAAHRDQFALMKGGKILSFYSSPIDARAAAEAFINDKLYSIQKVTDVPVDLGYFSHAYYRRTVSSGTGTPVAASNTSST